MSNSNKWGIVLAAGEGSRVREFLSALCGGRGIKQFCSVLGKRLFAANDLGSGAATDSPRAYTHHR